LSESNGTIIADWLSDIGSGGSAILRQGNARAESNVETKSDVRNWDSFKSYVASLTPEQYVFRGQAASWPLRTAFHRSTRSDLLPFIQRDVPSLLNNLSGKLRHLYDLSNPTMNASFWALAQHHGYPTPLLDWTYSPFVAAYFAYASVSPKQTTGSVRIFGLDRQRWTTTSQVFHLTHSYPMVRLFEPFVLENDRSIPQQSIMMISNIDDIEDFISWHEATEKQKYLFAIDLPVSERIRVLSELRLMGISAGGLFPGIDGTCRDLKERFFPEY